MQSDKWVGCLVGQVLSKAIRKPSIFLFFLGFLGAPCFAASIESLGTVILGGISRDGSTVVGGVRDDFAPFQAFKYKNGELTRLGFLPNENISSFGQASFAAAASDGGSVIVGNSTSTARPDPFQDPEAAIFEGGSTRGLGSPVPGRYFAESSDVSADGNVMIAFGFNFREPPPGSFFTIDSFVVDDQGFELIEAGGTRTSANAISADGSVVVGHTNFRAFSFSNGQSMLLGSLSGPNGFSIASNVSSDGSTIVGGSDSADGEEAFVFQNGVMTALEDLEGGQVRSWARAVSGDGSIIAGRGRSSGVGSSEFGTLGDEAVLWIRDDEGNYSINRVVDLLFGAGVDVSADGWSTLLEVEDISDDGTRLIGQGIKDGVQQGFIVTFDATEVPLPASFSFFLMALLPLVFKAIQTA